MPRPSPRRAVRSPPASAARAAGVPAVTATAAHRHIYAVVTRIPKGYVATYGQVAELAGLPRRARLVGRALRALPATTRVPWHRVVNAQGRISLRADGLGHEELQARLLRREGVSLVRGAISFARHRWPVGT